MKKKIIFVTKALWIGGIETALVNLLNYFDYDKYDVTLLVLCDELDMKNEIHPKCRVLVADRDNTYSFKKQYKYKRLYHLTEKADKPSQLHRIMMWTVPLIKWIENRLYIKYIYKLMMEEHFDTAIIYSDVVAEITIKAIQADKYIMFYHHGIMRHVYHDKIAYKKCDKIIAVSNKQADELKKYVPNAANKIITIHNLINVNGIRQKANQKIEEYFDKSKFNIVSVGRVSYEKGMDIAVCIGEKLVAHGLDNFSWWIVGDGPAMQEVKNIIQEKGMGKYIITVGMKSNPYPYISQADLYVQPSRFEGYPMTILEALVLGQPVVSTDNNGAKEILQEGITGLLRPVEIDKLAEAVEFLLYRKDELIHMKENILHIDFHKKNKDLIERLETLL